MRSFLPLKLEKPIWRQKEYRSNNDNYNDSNKGFTGILLYEYKIIQVIVTLQMMTGKKGATWSYMVSKHWEKNKEPMHHLPTSIIFLKGLGLTMSTDSVYLLPLSLAISEKEESSQINRHVFSCILRAMMLAGSKWTFRGDEFISGACDFVDKSQGKWPYKR